MNSVAPEQWSLLWRDYCHKQLLSPDTEQSNSLSLTCHTDHYRTLTTPHCDTSMDVSDPLRTLENDESDDLFKSAFNGSAGVIKITTSQINDNITAYNTEVITRLEVITRFPGDSGGDLQMNDIMNDIMELLITKTSSAFDLSSDNFKVYSTTNEGVSYVQEDTVDHTYFRAILELGNKIEQTS